MLSYHNRIELVIYVSNEAYNFRMIVLLGNVSKPKNRDSFGYGHVFFLCSIFSSRYAVRRGRRKDRTNWPKENLKKLLKS